LNRLVKEVEFKLCLRYFLPAFYGFPFQFANKIKIMNAKTKKISLTILVFISVIGLIYLAANNLLDKNVAPKASTKTENSIGNIQKSAAIINPAVSELLEISPNEAILGDKNAPVTLIEYASLSCSHCASFYEDGFPKLKKQYIDTNKVRFIYRDFPLNKPALDAAVIALCKYEKNNNAKEYFSFLKALFKTQESWAFTQEFAQKLEVIAKLDGLSKEDFDSCLNNIETQKRILTHRQQASDNLKISSTPTFFINGQKLSGYSSFGEVKKIIDQELDKTNTK
jgi:protein-disulfide isomerase